MYQELTIALPEQTAHLIELMTDKRNISRFVEDAVNYYIKHAGKEELREQLKQGAVKRAERDLKLSQEWNSLLIKPLTRLDKLRLIAHITKMLQEEEELPEKYFMRGFEYPIMTPTVTPDDTSYKAAFQLQQLLEENNKSLFSSSCAAGVCMGTL